MFTLGDLKRIAQNDTDLPVADFQIQVQGDQYVEDAIFWLHRYFEEQIPSQAVPFIVNNQIAGYITETNITPLYESYNFAEWEIAGRPVSLHLYCCSQCDGRVGVYGPIRPGDPLPTCNRHRPEVTMEPCPDAS